MENKSESHKSFNEFDLGLGQNYQQFLKWSSTHFCPLTCVFMQSGVLSADDHKTKILINLKSTEDTLHLQHHTQQDLILYGKAQKVVPSH